MDISTSQAQSEKQENGSFFPEDEDYRQSIRKQINSAIKSSWEEEIHKGILEIQEEQRRAITEVVEEQRIALQKVVDEEKKAIWTKIEENKKNLIEA